MEWKKVPAKEAVKALEGAKLTSVEFSEGGITRVSVRVNSAKGGLQVGELRVSNYGSTMELFVEKEDAYKLYRVTVEGEGLLSKELSRNFRDSGRAEKFRDVALEQARKLDDNAKVTLKEIDGDRWAWEQAHDAAEDDDEKKS